MHTYEVRPRKDHRGVDIRSNQSLQPTAGRSDVCLSHNFNTQLRSKARSRQRWLR